MILAVLIRLDYVCHRNPLINTFDDVKIPNKPPPPFLSFRFFFLSDTVPFRLSKEFLGVPLAFDVSMTEELLRSSKGMSAGMGKPDLYLSITALESCTNIMELKTYALYKLRSETVILFSSSIGILGEKEKVVLGCVYGMITIDWLKLCFHCQSFKWV